MDSALRPRLCLFTDSLDPSGVGEHMLALAAELRARFRVSVVFPPTDAGLVLLRRARALELDTLALEVRGDPAATVRFVGWLREGGVRIVHGHAGVGWEGHHGIRAARSAGVPAVLRTEHVFNIIDDPRTKAEHARIVGMVDRLICVSRGVADSFIRAGIPEGKVCVVLNGIDPRRHRPIAPMCVRGSGWDRTRGSSSPSPAWRATRATPTSPRPRRPSWSSAGGTARLGW